MSFLNETFNITNKNYIYNFDTNILEYANGTISTHTTPYPYDVSPYRAIVNGKLNLA